MKYLFVCLAIVLILCSLALKASFPDQQSDVPIVYWVTDDNPARRMQVQLFHEWLVKQGHVGPNGEPGADLRLYPVSAAHGRTQRIIQAVSGVSSEIIQLVDEVQFFNDLGVLENLDPYAKEMGFDTSQTWPAIKPAITAAGEQYAFPCNVFTNMYWVNLDTFKKYGMDPPSQRWTLEEYEQMGLEFIKRANPPDHTGTRVFFDGGANVYLIHRSMGLSRFNETLTHSLFNDPRYADAFKLKKKWMDLQIIPSRAQMEAFDVTAGYGGPVMQLFNRGDIAMFSMGRYALIQLRRFGALNMTVVEPPHGGFPSTDLHTRCAGVYVDSNSKEAALLFLSYLASEDYNTLIVRDADALPPNPYYTTLEEFQRPPDHPNEWGVHKPFADAAASIAITTPVSPFVLDSIVTRVHQQAEEQALYGTGTVEEATMRAYNKIEEEIKRTLEEHVHLRDLYEQFSKDQETIDQLRAEGKKVPARLIRNPYHLAYYRAQGWLEEEPTE